MSSEIAIKVENLSKCYQIYDQPHDRLKQMILPRIQQLVSQSPRQYCREFWALKDISFDIKKGETVGIIGRNGSGKSTLLQIITGTLAPTTGSVKTHGRISALLELGSGFNPEFTGRENVYLNCALLGLGRADVDERFDLIASFADIGEFIDSPVKHYSSGMFARLAFSVAIHVDPEILIVDEILAVGDSAFQRRCLQKFYDIRSQGCSILFVSHDAYQIKTICQRALYLKNGRPVAFGRADLVVDQYTIDTESTGHTSSADSVNSVELTESAANECRHPFKIIDVSLLRSNNKPFDGFICTNESVEIDFRYVAIEEKFPRRGSFVFNLKRHDDFYVCGGTTLMDDRGVVELNQSGRVRLKFPRLNILAGRYKLRIAINDEMGIGIFGEICSAVEFCVIDEFRSHGLIELEREWILESVNGN